jgi:arylsulfatase A-like enzyme
MNPANAQQLAPIVSAPGTTATARVTPAPGQPPFEGIIAPTVRESTPYWPAQPRAPQGAPNVVFIMLDDFGFSQLGCYGAQGLRTPNIDKLAANGLRYNNFHATPLCSPTRAAFLTGRNHHSCALITSTQVIFGGFRASNWVSTSAVRWVGRPGNWASGGREGRCGS